MSSPALPVYGPASPLLWPVRMDAKRSTLPRRRQLFLTLLLAFSGVLIIKPPPYDIVLIIAIIIALLSGKMPIRPRNAKALGLLAVYGGATIASSLSAHSVWEGVWYDGLTVFCLLLWWYFSELFERYGLSGVSPVMNGYVITSLVGTAFGLIVLNFDVPYQEELLYYGRPTGMFLDANVFGSSLVPAMLYSLAQAVRNGGSIKRIWWSASFLTICIGLVATLSRGAFVNAALSITTFMLLMAWRWPSARKAILMISISLVAIGATYFVIGGVFGLSDSVMRRTQLQSYDEERWRVHAAALELAKDHPLLGVGPGQFAALGSPIQVLYHGKYQALATHNTYLHVTAESGLLAVVPLLLFILVVVHRGYKGLRHAKHQSDIITAAWVLACLTGALVGAWVIDAYHWRHLWLLFALPWCRPSSSSRAAGFGACFPQSIPLREQNHG